jgi:integrase
LSSLSTGTVYQRKDGRWVAAVRLDGRRISRYAKTERDAKLLLKELLGQQHTGTLTAPTRITLGEWVRDWLDSLDGERRPKTLLTYRQALCPVANRLGSTRLDKLTPVVLSRLFVELRRSGSGTRRLQQTHTVLGTCLRAAVRLGILSYSPLDRVDKPRHEGGERRYWTFDEARRFLGCASTSPARYAPLCAMLLATGLRPSEALGLRWEDVDPAGRCIRVERALVFVQVKPTMQTPKSRAGRRTVSLPDIAIQMVQRLPRPLDPSLPVFTSGAGTPPNPNNLRRALHGLCDDARVPRLPPHGLRHVHAAMLAGLGLDPHTLKRRLGHARVSTTMDVYAYAIQPERVAAEAFDRALGS